MLYSGFSLAIYFILSCCRPVTQSCPTLCNPMDCSTPGFSALHLLLDLAQTPVHQVGAAIQPSCPLVFSNEFALCLRYWRFSFGISPFFEYSRLISFRIDCLISLQYHSINSVYVSISIFQLISPAPPSGIRTSVLYICVFISALQISSSVSVF